MTKPTNGNSNPLLEALVDKALERLARSLPPTGIGALTKEDLQEALDPLSRTIEQDLVMAGIQSSKAQRAVAVVIKKLQQELPQAQVIAATPRVMVPAQEIRKRRAELLTTQEIEKRLAYIQTEKDFYKEVSGFLRSSKVMPASMKVEKQGEINEDAVRFIKDHLSELGTQEKLVEGKYDEIAKGLWGLLDYEMGILGVASPTQEQVAEIIQGIAQQILPSALRLAQTAPSSYVSQEILNRLKGLPPGQAMFPAYGPALQPQLWGKWLKQQFLGISKNEVKFALSSGLYDQTAFSNLGQQAIRADQILEAAGFPESHYSRTTIKKDLERLLGLATRVPPWAIPYEVLKIEANIIRQLNTARETMEVFRDYKTALRQTTQNIQDVVAGNTARVELMEKLETFRTGLRKSGLPGNHPAVLEIQEQIFRILDTSDANFRPEKFQIIRDQVARQVQASFKKALEEQRFPVTMAQIKAADANIREFGKANLAFAYKLAEEQSADRYQQIKETEAAILELRRAGLKANNPAVLKLKTEHSRLVNIEDAVVSPEIAKLERDRHQAEVVDSLEMGLTEISAQNPVHDKVQQTLEEKIAAPTQLTTTEVLLREREIAQKMINGQSAASWRATIEALTDKERANLPTDHPAVQEAMTREREFSEFEKTHPQFTKTISRSNTYAASRGQSPIYDRWLGHLPNPTQQVRTKIDQIFSQSKLFKELKLSRVQSVLRFRPSEFIIQRLTRYRFSSFSQLGSFIYQKTLGRVFAALVQTGIGQAIKKGLTAAATKVATWAATRLGIEAGIMAAGAAGAVPSGGLTLLISAAINLVIEIGKKIFGFGKKIIAGLLSKIGIEGKKSNVVSYLLIGGGIILVTQFSSILIPVGIVLIATGVAGVAAVGIGSFATGVTAFFTALLVAPIGAGVTFLVVGTLAGLAITTFFIVMLTGGAFVVPINPYETAIPQEVGCFEVYKTPPRSEFENTDLPVTVDYKISIIPKSDPVVIDSIIEQWSISCDNPYNPAEPPPEVLPTPAPDGQISAPWTYEFDKTYEANMWENCSICNTVTAVGHLAEGGLSCPPQSTTACVIIGTPPEDCPSGWPTDTGWVGQGPVTTASCTTHNGQQAIDIEGACSSTIRATHSGIATAGYDPGGRGYYVTIEGICGGKTFTTNYYHLQGHGVSGPVNKGDPIGTVNNTGDSTGCHLHYEIKDLGSINNYLPKAVPEKCCSVCSCLTSPCLNNGQIISW